MFEQIGKRLTKKSVTRFIPVVSGAIGAAFDTVQMNKIVTFADIFYQKRFILEKQLRQKLHAATMHDTPEIKTIEVNDGDDTVIE